eukprot:Opistho-2@12505
MIDLFGNICRIGARPIRRWLVPQPGILPLGVLARRRLRALQCLVAGERTLYKRSDFRDTNGAADRRVDGNIAALQQVVNFFDRPFVEHRAQATIATFREPGAVGKQDQRRKVDGIADPADAFRLPCRKGASGRTHDLEGAGNPRGIGGLEAIGGLWICLAEQHMRLRHRHCAHFRSDRRIDLRHRRDPVEQGADIHAGPARQHWQAATLMRRRDLRLCLLGPACGGIGLGACDMAEQPMRRLRFFFRRWPRAQHPQLGIDLCRIRVDHRPAGAPRKRDRQSGLAAGGRACNERHPWLWGVRHVHRYADSSGSA